MFDHLVIEMKNKGYKPGPASSFFRALCASQVGLGIGPDIRGSFGGGFSAEKFRARWDQTKKKFRPPCGIHCGIKTYLKKTREEKVYANSVVRLYSMLA